MNKRSLLIEFYNIAIAGIKLPNGDIFSEMEENTTDLSLLLKAAQEIHAIKESLGIVKNKIEENRTILEKQDRGDYKARIEPHNQSDSEQQQSDLGYSLNYDLKRIDLEERALQGLFLDIAGGSITNNKSGKLQKLFHLQSGAWAANSIVALDIRIAIQYLLLDYEASHRDNMLFNKLNKKTPPDPPRPSDI